MNIIDTEHEERIAVDSDGEEGWCFVSATGSVDAESSQMAYKCKEDTLNDDFDFCAISSSDHEDVEGCFREDEKDFSYNDHEGSLADMEASNQFQNELDPDVLQFADSHFQLKEIGNSLITTTLLHQANFYEKQKTITKENKKPFSVFSFQESNKENVLPIDFMLQILQKSQRELDTHKITKDLTPCYPILDTHRVDFCEITKVGDAEFDVISSKVISQMLLIEKLRELNSDESTLSKISDQNEFEILDSPQDSFCEISKENNVPFDGISERVIPDIFLTDVLREMQNELSSNEEAAAEVFEPRHWQDIKVDVASFNMEKRSSQNDFASDDGGRCCNTVHDEYQGDFDQLIRQYYLDQFEYLPESKREDEFLVKYDNWDSHPTSKKMIRKMAPFNRHRVRLTRKRNCRKGHWNCKLQSYYYS